MLEFLLVTLVPAALLFAVVPIVVVRLMIESCAKTNEGGRPRTGRAVVYAAKPDEPSGTYGRQPARKPHRGFAYSRRHDFFVLRLAPA